MLQETHKAFQRVKDMLSSRLSMILLRMVGILLFIWLWLTNLLICTSLTGWEFEIPYTISIGQCQELRRIILESNATSATNIYYLKTSSLLFSLLPQSGYTIQFSQIFIISTSLSRRITRWLLQLSEFHIIVVTPNGTQI